jgi:hypothetical protein
MTPKYMDDQIRRAINQHEETENKTNQSIYEGVTIGNTYYRFEETPFFEGRLMLQVPAGFIDMPDDVAQIKYPSGSRPQIIRTDLTGSINITLSLLGGGIREEQIGEVRDGIKRVIKSVNPSHLFFEEGIAKANGKSVGFFTFKSAAIDMPLYNLMFIMEIEQRILMGNFSCPYSQYKEWQPIARQIMQSVRVGSASAENTAGGQKL